MVYRILLVLSILALPACGSGADSEEGASFYPQPFILQNTSEMCVEYTPSSQMEQDQLQSQGWYLGNCSRSNYLGVCEQQHEGSGFYASVVYYQDDNGLLTTETLRQSCLVSQGRFIEGNQETTQDTSGDVTRTYIVQENSIACTEYVGDTQASHNHIEMSGGIEGMCSRNLALGVCEKPDSGVGFRSNTIYYPDEAGLRTAESLVSGCEDLNGTFIYASNDISHDTSGDVTRTYIIQENSIACTEYVGDTQASHNHIEMSGGIEGMCSRNLALGVCQKPDNGVGFRSNTIYYPDEAGLRTAESLVSGCEHLNGTFIYGSDGSTPDPEPEPDITAPVLSEITGIGSTFDLSPRYIFNSTEPGQVTWVQGSCTSETTAVVEGNNLIELSALTSGEYFNCEFTVTDNAGNQSGPLILSSFTIITPDSDFDGFADFVELEYETDPFDATSNPMAILANAVDFTDDNDSDGFSDELEAWYYTDPNHADSKPVDLDNDLIPDDFDSNSDLRGPRLLGFALSDNEKNIDTGNETVTFNLTVVDDISGIDGIWVTLRSPSSGQYVSTSIYGGTLGGKVHSLSLNSSAFGEFVESGTWKVEKVELRDVANNYNNYDFSELVSSGFDSEIMVSNDNSDVVDPILETFTISEESINIVTGSETVTFNLTVSDATSGIDGIWVTLRSPSSGQYVSTSIYGGTLGGKFHSLSLNSSAFGEFVESGTWKVEKVELRDVANNYNNYDFSELVSSGFDSEIMVRNDNSDVVDPILETFTISEESINIVTGLETVTFNLTVSDATSGIDGIWVTLRSPSSGQYVSTSIYGGSLGGKVHSLSLNSSSFGEFVESGIWKVEKVELRDVANNYNNYDFSELVSSGFDSEIEVTNSN